MSLYAIENPKVYGLSEFSLYGVSHGAVEANLEIETTVGANTSISSAKCRMGEFTVPAGGITVSHGFFYGYTGDTLGGTFTMAIFDTSMVQVGACSAQGNIAAGGSSSWNTVTWAIPIALSAGTYRIALYPSKGIVYHFDAASNNAWVISSIQACPAAFSTTASNFPKLSVANYDAHGAIPETGVFYLTENGAGTGDGSTLLNAMSVSTHNSRSFDPGNTIYLSGTIESTLIPPSSGSAGQPITYDGYEAGDWDPTVSGENTNAALITHNTVPETKISKYGFSILGKDYITLKGIRFKLCDVGIYQTTASAGSQKRSEHNTVKQCYFYHCYGRAAHFAYRSGEELGSNYLTFGGAVGDGNYVLACGYNRYPWTDNGSGGSALNDPCNIAFDACDNLIVSHNKLIGGGYSDDRDFYWGSNVVEISSQTNANADAYQLWEYNEVSHAGCEALLAFKEDGIENVIVRFNKLHTALGFINVYSGTDISGTAITVGGQSRNFYIYGNMIYNTHFGIRVGNQSSEVYIWANLLRDIYADGLIYLITDAARYTAPYQSKVVNNTLYNVGITRTVNALGGTQVYDIDSGEYAHSWTGFNIFHVAAGAWDSEIKNNVMYNIRNAATSNHHWADFREAIKAYIDSNYNSAYRSSVTTDWFYYGDDGILTLAGVRNDTHPQDANSNHDSFSLTDPAAGTVVGLRPTALLPAALDVSGVLATVSVQGVSHGAGELDMGYILDSLNSDFSGWPIEVTMADNSESLHRGAVKVIGDTYYVAETATGNGSGSNTSNLMSVSSHNTGSFSAGDLIYLYGTINSQITVPSSGTAGNYIIYRGYDTNSVIDLNSVEHRIGIFLQEKDWIWIDQIEIKEMYGTGAAGIQLYRGNHNIKITRCTIHDGGTRGVSLTAGVGEERNTNVIIGGSLGMGNEIYNIDGNGGLGNNDYSSACADILVAKSDDIVISYNHLYGTGDYATTPSSGRGVDGIMFERVNTDSEVPTGGTALIERNHIHDHNYWNPLGGGGSGGCMGEDGIDIKLSSNNTIIRDNHIYNHLNQSGITIQLGSHSNQVYRNLLRNNLWANMLSMCGVLTLGSDDHAMNDNVWWGNISIEGGAGIRLSSSGWQSSHAMQDYLIFNNTLAENGNKIDLSHGGYHHQRGDRTVVKNNAHYRNTDGVGFTLPNLQIHIRQYQQNTLTHNFYDHGGTVSTDIVYASTETADDYNPRTLTEWKASPYDQDSNSSEGDAGMIDPANYNYKPDTGSALINSGTSMGTGFYLWTASPAIDWDPTTTSGPDVADPEVVGWPIGAIAQPAN